MEARSCYWDLGIHVSNSRNSVVCGESHRIYCKSTNRPRVKVLHLLQRSWFLNRLASDQDVRNYNTYRGHNRFKFIGAGTRTNEFTTEGKVTPPQPAAKNYRPPEGSAKLMGCNGPFGTAIVWGLHSVYTSSRK